MKVTTTKCSSSLVPFLGLLVIMKKYIYDFHIDYDSNSKEIQWFGFLFACFYEKNKIKSIDYNSNNNTIVFSFLSRFTCNYEKNKKSKSKAALKRKRKSTSQKPKSGEVERHNCISKIEVVLAKLINFDMYLCFLILLIWPVWCLFL